MSTGLLVAGVCMVVLVGGPVAIGLFVGFCAGVSDEIHDREVDEHNQRTAAVMSREPSADELARVIAEAEQIARTTNH